MNKILILIAASLVLTGCFSPYDRCMRRAGNEVTSIKASLATAEENLARGYAIHQTEVTYTYESTCLDENKNPYSCEKTAYKTEETPVAIDADLERSKVEELKASLAAAEARYSDSIKACQGLKGS